MTSQKSSEKRGSSHIPFKELDACPQCGSRELRKVHDQKYPDEEGIFRFVIYRCHNGHETPRRQLVVREWGFPPKKDWEGWY